MDKRVEFLLNEIRQQCFSQNSTFSDRVLELYLNEAQNQIRKVIFLSNNENNILKSQYEIPILSGVYSYDLPSRVFAQNSMTAVRGKYQFGDTEKYETLLPVSIRNFNKIYGYTLLNGKIMISSLSNSINLQSIEITYSGDLPNLARRMGKVSSISGNTVILSGYDSNIDFSEYTDYVTAVDKDSIQQDTDIEIITYTPSTGTLIVDNSSGISVGDYILAGENSVNKSKLPNLCEDYLKIYVERRIAKEDSDSKGFPISNLFYESERADIASIFAESNEDIRLPELSPNTIII